MVFGCFWSDWDQAMGVWLMFDEVFLAQKHWTKTMAQYGTWYKLFILRNHATLQVAGALDTKRLAIAPRKDSFRCADSSA